MRTLRVKSSWTYLALTSRVIAPPWTCIAPKADAFLMLLMACFKMSGETSCSTNSRTVVVRYLGHEESHQFLDTVGKTSTDRKMTRAASFDRDIDVSMMFSIGITASNWTFRSVPMLQNIRARSSMASTALQIET